MHITNTRSPSRAAPPTIPATTASVRTLVPSGVEVVLNMLPVVLLVSVGTAGLAVTAGVAVTGGLVVEELIVEELVVTMG